MPARHDKVKIAVAGAGRIGRRHIAILADNPRARLAAIVDPSDEAQALAARLGVRAFSSIEAMIEAHIADAVIVATPTQAHLSGALSCIEADLPSLVEKPVTTTPQEAAVLAAAAEKSGVPVLVGHHRRHNPLMARAREIVQSGGIGRVVALHATTWFLKPDDYFEPEWRRAPGAGPILTNLIHDVDLTRWIVGEIAAVQAVSSRAARGFPIEDTAAATLRFANGAIGTVTVSDAAVSPWSWEMTSRENADYPFTGQSCYMIAGSEGALDLPALRRWHYEGRAGWFEPLSASLESAETADPLVRQIEHFAAVARGEAEPLVTIADAARSLTVVGAIARAARTGQTVTLDGVG